MGNCQTEGGKQEMPVFDNYDSKWSEVNRNEQVTINGPIAYVNESEEGGLILFKQPADDNSQAKFQVVCDTAQTIIGVGIVDLDMLEGTEFSGHNKYGLDHGQFMVTSEKIVICSNDDKLDKKTIGFNMKQNDIVECIRQGQHFIIKNGEESVKFNLDDNKRYHYAVYLIGGWNANDGVCSPAAVKIID